MLRRLLVLAVLLAVPTVARAQLQAGTYDLTILFGGGEMQGTLVVTTRDSLDVTLNVGDHRSPVKVASRRGNHLVLESTVPGMPIHYELDFEGTGVRGAFTYNGSDGTVTGRRRP